MLEFQEGHQRKDNRSQAARPKPAHQRDRVAPEADTHHRQRHRRHADHRQTEDGIENRTPISRVLERKGDEQRAENPPDQNRQKHPKVFSRLDEFHCLVPQHVAKRNSADERRDETIAAQGKRAEVGSQPQSQCTDLHGGGLRPPTPGCHAEQPAAGDACASTYQNRQTDLGQRSGQPPAASTLGFGRYGKGKKERDDRGGDPVVQPALNVQGTADARRYSRVVEDRQTQRSISRRQDRAGQRSKGQPLHRE